MTASPFIASLGAIPEWTTEAICSSVDPDAWFPEHALQHATPKAVCNGCPVRRQCLAYALENDERWGIWGGLTPTERQRLTRRPA